MMSNNVPVKTKPIGTLQDFSATHVGHYETFLYGMVGTIWDITRLFTGTLTYFFLKDAPGSLSPRVDPGAVVFQEILSSRHFASCSSPPPRVVGAAPSRGWVAGRLWKPPPLPPPPPAGWLAGAPLENSQNT